MPMFDPFVPEKPAGRLAWTEIERDTSRQARTFVTWRRLAWVLDHDEYEPCDRATPPGWSPP